MSVSSAVTSKVGLICFVPAEVNNMQSVMCDYCLHLLNRRIFTTIICAKTERTDKRRQFINTTYRSVPISIAFQFLMRCDVDDSV